MSPQFKNNELRMDCIALRCVVLRGALFVMAARSLRVGGALSLCADGALSLRDGGALSLRVCGAFSLRVGGAFSLRVGGAQLSERHAVPTTGLQRAFGWSGAEAFVQQDAQECWAVIFEVARRGRGVVSLEWCSGARRERRPIF